MCETPIALGGRFAIGHNYNADAGLYALFRFNMRPRFQQ
jgi:hypothetical protein